MILLLEKNCFWSLLGLPVLEFELACLSYTPRGVGFSSDLGIGHCIYPTGKNSLKIITLSELKFLAAVRTSTNF